MDLSLWRSRSRIVAYVDLVLSTIGLVFTVLVVLLGAAATTVIVDQKDKHEQLKDIPESDLNAVIWMLWIAVALMAVIICIDLWAAVMLLKGTRPGADPKYALERARIWRNVNIIFLIFSVIFYAGSKSFFSLFVEVLFRGILLYIVCKFIGELQQLSVSSYSAPENVVVKQ